MYILLCFGDFLKSPSQFVLFFYVFKLGEAGWSMPITDNSNTCLNEDYSCAIGCDIS